jgi:hypothetical protein
MLLKIVANNGITHSPTHMLSRGPKQLENDQRSALGRASGIRCCLALRGALHMPLVRTAPSQAAALVWRPPPSRRPSCPRTSRRRRACIGDGACTRPAGAAALDLYEIRIFWPTPLPMVDSLALVHIMAHNARAKSRPRWTRVSVARGGAPVRREFDGARAEVRGFDAATEGAAAAAEGWKIARPASPERILRLRIAGADKCR